MRVLKLSSVRTRLTLWSVGVLALALVFFGGALRAIVQVNLNTAINRSLMQQAHQHQAMTARMFEPRSDDFDPAPHGPGPRGPGPDFDGPRGPGGPGPAGPGFGDQNPPRRAPPRPHNHPNNDPPGVLPARILDRHEHSLVAWSASNPWDTDTYPPSLQGQEVTSTVRVGVQRLRVFSVPIRLRNGQVVGVVQTAAYLTEVDAEVVHLTRALLMLIPLVLLIAGAGGAFLTGRTLRPVRSITQAANRISAESLSGRLTITGDDEFSELASTFNGMLARLEGGFRKLTVAYEQERRFTADASHELRTPLTVIKAHTSLALGGQPTETEYRESMEAIDLAVDQTNRLVQSLLLLARSDAGQLHLRRDPVLLTEVAARAVHITQKASEASIQVCLPEDVPAIKGDADALLQVFTNLLANAARHTPAEGKITLTVGEDASAVVVTVTDTGEGIAAEHLPHLFERFYRVESSRSRGKGGTGLGLAICREIVQAHHGSIAVESVVGRGTAVRVTLPQNPPVGAAGANGN